MESIKIKRLTFGSHVKLSSLFGLATGIVFGIFGFIGGLAGGNVTANFGTMDFAGATAGAISLVIAPLYLYVFGALTGVFTYLPFRLFMKFKKSIILNYVSTEFDNTGLDLVEGDEEVNVQ